MIFQVLSLAIDDHLSCVCSILSSFIVVFAVFLLGGVLLLLFFLSFKDVYFIYFLFVSGVNFHCIALLCPRVSFIDVF